ncbi:MAG: N-acetyl-D-Glu racemase DgcA [Candidatus Puniceispirillales bacterium]
MRINLTNHTFPLKKVFTISRGSRTEAEVLTVSIERDGFLGKGECVPYKRYNETIESVSNQITSISVKNRSELQKALPPGAARNALDCAFWDLEAKSKNIPAYELANLNRPQPIQTAFTLSLDKPENMAHQAKQNSHRPILKIKLGGGDLDLKRIESIAKNAPNSDIIVDANEGWSIEEYKNLSSYFLELGVKMVEQPLPAEKDYELIGIERLLPVCADESCHDRKSLESCKGKYDIINIKLDKTGGLTEAILLKEEAKAMGFKIMVGCMVGSSLAMAPAVMLSQDVSWVDLDGPLLLSKDRDNSLKYDEKGIHPPLKNLWG